MGTVSMNMPESNHIPADLGTPTWTQNQRAYKPNPQKGFVVQRNASENFGVDSDDARTAPMCSDHHTHGLILADAKFRFQNHDDEFTRRIVVIDQDDLVKAGSFDLEFILGGRSRVDVTHVRAAGHALAGAEPASARRRLASM